MKYLTKPLLLCTVYLLASCYEEATVSEESTSLMITLQMPNNQKGITRVGLNSIENSKDLYATWSPNDKVQAVLRRGNEMYDLGRAKVTNISEDQRTATINFDRRATPNFIPPYTIFLFTGNDHPASADMIGDGNWAAYCTYDLQRGVGGYFHAPLYCRLEVKSDGIIPTAQFQHFGTYELLHVYNATNLPITFAHQGFQTERPWYQATSKMWFYDGYDTSPYGEWDGDTESQTMTIMPNSENIVYSWYIPSGYPVSDASLIACINGKYGVLSSNTLSSAIMPQCGHAYHMYATWDGVELKFVGTPDHGTAIVPTDGLVAYFPFNGNANDESGCGNHGILSGKNLPELTTDRHGKANSAYHFGGFYNYNWIRVPNSELLKFDKQMTMSFWIRQTELVGMNGNMSYTSSDPAFAALCKAGDGNATFPGLYIMTSKGPGGKGLHVSTNNSNGNSHDHTKWNHSIGASNADYQLGDWMHIVLVVNNTEKLLYLDGVEAGHDELNKAADFTEMNKQDLYIGIMAGGDMSFSWSFGAWYPFYGDIDDVRVYRRALSATAITSLFLESGTGGATEGGDPDTPVNPGGDE